MEALAIDNIASWARLLLALDGGAFEDPEIVDRAFEAGLEMDAGEKFERCYDVSCFDLEGLQRALPEADNIKLLGDLAFSQWRGITHWGFHGDDSRMCLRLTLERIIELTKV